MSEGMIPNWEI